MKINNIFALSLATVLMAGGFASCSNELPFEGVTGDGNVIFSASLADETLTRALGDGLSVKILHYAVYESESGNLIETSTATVSDKHASVTLQLTTGVSYDIVFFARSNNGSCYTFDATNKTVTVDYTNMGGSTTKYKYDADCFYQVRKGYKAGSSSQENVILYRPVAQVNFGTNDLEADAVKKLYGSYVYSSITAQACKTLNLLTGEASDADEISIPFHRPVKGETANGDFPVAGYDYLTCAYLLVADPSELRDITLNTSDSSNGTKIIQSLTIPNAPTKRNYRTNIYGSLLTSTTDWNVEIESAFGGETNVWTGAVEMPVKVSETEYTVNSPAQMAGLAKMVNGGDDFAGKMVTLTADIDLAYRNWTPVGTFDNPFNGIFDGQNHTVTGLNVTLGKSSQAAGLFGVIRSNGSNKAEVRNLTIDGATVNTLAATPSKHAAGVAVGHIYTAKCIENVTVRNATVDAYHWAGGIVGKGYGSVNDCTVENVTVTAHFEDLGPEFDNGDKVGAIIGQQDEGKFTLTGNKAINVKVTGYRHVGGLFGHVNYAYSDAARKEVSNNSVTGAVVTQVFTHNYKNLTAGQLIGEIAGEFGNYVNQSGNTASDVTLVLPTSVSTAEELAAAVTKDGNVNLSADITVTSDLAIGKNTRLNLNGHNITLNNARIEVSGELTVEGKGVLTSGGFTVVGNPGSTIIINNGDIRTTGSTANAVNTEGNLVVNGGKISGGGTYAVTMNWANVHDQVCTLEINGGEMTTANNYALNIYAGNSQKNHKAVINDGIFVATSGARADGNVAVDIYGGQFIQTASNSTGHAFCAGAESNGSSKTRVNIYGGYFYGNAGYAVCNANEAVTTVKGAFINKTGGNFTLASGSTVETLASPVTKSVGGTTYSFGYQVK